MKFDPPAANNPCCICNLKLDPNTSPAFTLPSPAPQPAGASAGSPQPKAPSPSTPSSSSSSAGAIAGGVVGALAFAGVAVAAFVLWRRRKRSRAASALSEPDKSLEDGRQPPVFQVRPRSLPPPPVAPPRLSSPFASAGPAAHRLDSAAGPPLFSMEPYSTTASTIHGSDPKASLPAPGTPAMDSLGGRAVAADSKSRTATPVSSGGTPVSERRRSSKQQRIIDTLDVWEVQWDAIALEECIGKGSFGKVFTARWNETPVAVKRLDDLDALLHSEPPETRRQLLEALHAEAGLMAALRHPNVVAFMGFCAAPPAIVTELCARGSLTDVLKAATRNPATLPWPRRLRMAIDAATGMHHLHSQVPPIVHRDLKSPNLLVDKDWNVKVSDGMGLLSRCMLPKLFAHTTAAHPPPRHLAARSRTSTCPR